MVRINGLDTDLWKEDIRASVAGGCDTIRIPKTESAEQVKIVVQAIEEAEIEYNRLKGSILVMAALESAKGVMKALDICESSERMIGVALSGGDYTKDLQTHITGTGLELMGARQHMLIAARAAKVQCFDTVYTNLDDMEGFQKDVETVHLMGFDVREIEDKKEKGIGVFTVDGKMIDIAFYDGAKRTILLAKASGVYKGDL